jgi:acetylornithine deacetylase/succinyl-diaminopimelate desuccinylase-like protein
MREANDTVLYRCDLCRYTRGTTFREACVFGPGDIAQAHMTDEYCSVPELLLLDGILQRWLQE